jgi:methionine biosynthesis protein MetW
MAMNAIRDWLVRYAQQGVRYNAEQMIALCESHPGATLLDLGCGDGEFTARVSEQVRAAKIIGIDIMPENLIAARTRGIIGIEADLNAALPVNDETIDVVIASNVIEHVYDTDLFVKEMYRVLRPGGYAIVSTPNLAAWYNILFLVLGHQPPSANVSDVAPLGLMERKVWGGRYKGEIGHRVSNKHRRVFVRSTLVGLLQFYGFQCQKVVASGFPPLSRSVANLVCHLIPMYAWQILVRAIKVR